MLASPLSDKYGECVCLRRDATPFSFPLPAILPPPSPPFPCPPRARRGFFFPPLPREALLPVAKRHHDVSFFFFKTFFLTGSTEEKFPARVGFSSVSEAYPERRPVLFFLLSPRPFSYQAFSN